MKDRTLTASNCEHSKNIEEREPSLEFRRTLFSGAKTKHSDKKESLFSDIFRQNYSSFDEIILEKIIKTAEDVYQRL